MYKFRDVHDEERRTVLQANFASVTLAVQTIPSLITTYFAMRYGHMWRLRSRVLLTLLLIILCFGVTTIFVKVDTDECEYQNLNIS